MLAQGMIQIPNATHGGANTAYIHHPKPQNVGQQNRFAGVRLLASSEILHPQILILLVGQWRAEEQMPMMGNPCSMASGVSVFSSLHSFQHVGRSDGVDKWGKGTPGWCLRNHWFLRTHEKELKRK